MRIDVPGPKPTMPRDAGGIANRGRMAPICHVSLDSSCLLPLPQDPSKVPLELLSKPPLEFFCSLDLALVSAIDATSKKPSSQIAYVSLTRFPP